jgi:glycosyltransferase involved in cell wall biosynthesis
VLYESLGSGGACHYTHELAEALTQSGCIPILLTNAGYELEALPKHYETLTLFGRRSRLKTLTIRFKKHLSRLRGKSHAAANEQMHTLSSEWPVARKPSLLSRIRVEQTRFTALLCLIRKKPDVVHFQWLSDPLGELRFMRLLKALGFKLVYTAHNVLPHDGDAPAARELFRKVYELADLIIVHAEQNRQELLRLFPVTPRKIAVVPHGSYQFFFSGKANNQNSAREELGLPLGKKIILFFGLIRKYKGLNRLIEAFDVIRQSVNDTALLIVGKVPDGDLEGRKSYADQMASLGCHGDVICEPTYIPFERIGLYFLAADVVALPYIKTYQSGVLMSAYAAGKPVVVTDTGGMGEVVEDGKSGLVVPPDNAEALANALLEILRDPRQMWRMGARARELAQTEYSWDRIAGRTVELYRSLLVATR